MTRPLMLVLALIAVAAIAVPGWLVLTWDPATSKQAELQPMAESSCKCARSTHDKADKATCWQHFEIRAGRHISDATATACFPLSTNMICFDHDGMNHCVTVGYDIVGGDGGGDFCTEAEAKQAEAIYNREYSGQGSEAEQNAAMSRADAAIRRFAKMLAQGREVTALPPSHGCVSDNGG